MNTRIRNTAYWLLPLLFCLAVYWYGLKAWFSGDDFLWLGITRRVYDWSSLWQEIFTPTIHGTFRPLSERAFFLVFRALFDLDNVPYRIWVFLTQFGSLVLTASIVWRITGSRLAGFLAPVIWMANSNMAHVMTWDSAYMQILCGFSIRSVRQCRCTEAGEETAWSMANHLRGTSKTIMTLPQMPSIRKWGLTHDEPFLAFHTTTISPAIRQRWTSSQLDWKDARVRCSFTFTSWGIGNMWP